MLQIDLNYKNLTRPRWKNTSVDKQAVLTGLFTSINKSFTSLVWKVFWQTWRYLSWSPQNNFRLSRLTLPWKDWQNARQPFRNLAFLFNHLARGKTCHYLVPFFPAEKRYHYLVQTVYWCFGATNSKCIKPKYILCLSQRSVPRWTHVMVFSCWMLV